MGGKIHPRGVPHRGLPDENTRHTRRTVEPVSSAIVRIDTSLQEDQKMPYHLLLLSKRRKPRGPSARSRGPFVVVKDSSF